MKCETKEEDADVDVCRVRWDDTENSHGKLTTHINVMRVRCEKRTTTTTTKTAEAIIIHPRELAWKWWEWEWTKVIYYCTQREKWKRERKTNTFIHFLIPSDRCHPFPSSSLSSFSYMYISTSQLIQLHNKRKGNDSARWRCCCY